MKKIFALLLLLSFSAVYALNCSVCKKKIRGQYLTNTEQTVFCSKECFATTRPKCTKCNNPCINTYSFMKKPYCSEECVYAVSQCANCEQPTPRSCRIIINPEARQKIFCPACAVKPPCYYCSFPDKTTRLPDNRYICSDCRKTAVTSAAVIQQKVKKIRRKLSSMYGFDPHHHIELIILNLPELEKECQEIYRPASGSRIALMRFNYVINEKTTLRGRKKRRISQQRCRIFILKNTPEHLLEDAIAHELAHDYLRHNAGKVKDLAIEEGFAEAIAAEYNKAINHPLVNIRKQNEKDPVYGGGYRKMSEYMQKNGFRKTVQFIKSNSVPYL